MNINQIQVGDRVDCYPVAYAPHIAFNARVTKLHRSEETVDIHVDGLASGVKVGPYYSIPVDEVLRRRFGLAANETPDGKFVEVAQ